MLIFVTTCMILSATMVLLPQWIADKLKKNSSIVSRNNDQKKPTYVASPTYVTVYGLQVPIKRKQFQCPQETITRESSHM